MRFCLPTLFFAAVVFAVLCEPNAHAQLTPYKVAEPAVASSTSNLVTSPLFLDASQFAGADMCSQINAAYMSAQFTGEIDASSFSGSQPCNSNPFHGKNAVVHLYLNPNVTIVTSVPWFTPQVTHSIEGMVAGNIQQTGGATIEACGPTAPEWSLITANCTANGVTVPAFPDLSNAQTVVMQFQFPHGPFPAGTYSCVLCVSGQGTGGEGLGWNKDGDSSRISSVKIELSGNSNIFGYYTMTGQERTELIDSRGGPSCGINCANVFYDRAEAPGGSSGNNAGVTRPVLRDFNMAGENGGSGCTSCYGVAFEGGDALVQITQGNCSQQPIAYFTSMPSGQAISTNVKIANNGVSGCNTVGTNPTCAVFGAPIGSLSVTSGVLSGTDTTIPTTACIVHFTGHVISFISFTTTSGFQTSFVTGGPLMEDINAAPTTTAKFENALQ